MIRIPTVRPRAGAPRIPGRRRRLRGALSRCRLPERRRVDGQGRHRAVVSGFHHQTDDDLCRVAAVRDGRLTMDTPLTMSRRAARLPPSKMGFRPGTLVTLDNALKMLMVKSPNDVAWMIGEGISGTMESFRRRNERGGGQARDARIALRQSQRAARSRPLFLGARHGDPGAGAVEGVSRPCRPLRHRRIADGADVHPQP